MSSTDPRAAILEAQTLAFVQALDAQGGPPIYTLTPADARNLLLGAQTSGNVIKEPAELEDRTISGGPTGTISLRIVRPQGSGGRTLPAILYIHGGGWVLGDKETHDRLVRELANGAQATLVFVDYPRSPEAKYPSPLSKPTAPWFGWRRTAISSTSIQGASRLSATVSAATWLPR